MINIFISFFIIISSLLFFLFIEFFLVFGSTKKTIDALNQEGLFDLSTRLKFLTDKVGIMPLKGYPSEIRKEWHSIWKEIKNIKSQNPYLKKLAHRLFLLHISKNIYFFVFSLFFVVTAIYLVFITST